MNVNIINSLMNEAIIIWNDSDKTDSDVANLYHNFGVILYELNRVLSFEFFNKRLSKDDLDIIVKSFSNDDDDFNYIG